MHSPVLDDAERQLLDDLKSDNTDQDKMLKLGLHMISWQKSERNKINGFYKEYTAPLYELINLTRERMDLTHERMDKLEDSHMEMCESLREMADAQKDSNREIVYMVKCVDKAIIESEKDKERYSKQHKDFDDRLDAVEKDLVRLDTNWFIFGKIGVSVIGLCTVIIGILQLTK